MLYTRGTKKSKAIPNQNQGLWTTAGPGTGGKRVDGNRLAGKDFARKRKEGYSEEKKKGGKRVGRAVSFATFNRVACWKKAKTRG